MQLLKKVEACNYKSFNNIEINLNNFSVILGGNASGKTNFVSIFKFMKDILNEGLDTAIALQGGIEYLRNINIDKKENLVLRFEFAIDKNDGLTILNARRIIMPDEELAINVNKIIYEFEIGFYLRKKEYKIIKEYVGIFGDCQVINIKDYKKVRNLKSLGKGEFSILRNQNEISRKLSLNGVLVPGINYARGSFRLNYLELSNKMLLLERPYESVFFKLRECFSQIQVYNIDPKMPKHSTLITGKKELEPDGSNLSLILKNIWSNKETKKMYLTLLNDILPFIEDFKFENLLDNTLMLRYKEKYWDKKYLPSFLISDGTININSMLTLLYFNKKNLLIIEEPERNIHPKLISKIVDMIKEVSNEKQIIITTHSVEIVKYVDIESLIFIRRNEKGYSELLSPKDDKDLAIFLKNELGKEELFIQGIWG